LKPQESWDNSGLQIGSLNDDIKNIMLTLNIDYEAVEQAVKNNVQLIITHHPFLFSSLKSIDYSTYEGKVIRELILNNINLYSMHTNFDMADKGVNHQLAEKLNIGVYETLNIAGAEGAGYGGIGNISPRNIIEYASEVKTKLNTGHIKLYCNDKGRNVSRVAFCGGSGSEFIYDAISKGADVYITGDIKYHQAQSALQNNLCIIDAGHYYTEYHSMRAIEHVLSSYNEFNVSVLERNTANEIII